MYTMRSVKKYKTTDIQDDAHAAQFLGVWKV